MRLKGRGRHTHIYIHITYVTCVKFFDLWYKVDDEQYVIRVGKPRGRHVAGVSEIELSYKSNTVTAKSNFEAA